MVEVDRERGRIGLRLADDPEVAGKTVEELATVGTGDGGPPGVTAATAAIAADRGRDGRGPRSAATVIRGATAGGSATATRSGRAH